MATTTETVVTVRCRPFNRTLSSARCKVRHDGTVSVYDDTAGHYTTCHSLTATELGRVRAAAKRARKANESGYALVGSDSRIVSLHDSRESADSAGWGHDRELVQLVRSHSVGDTIEYSDRGVEI